MAHSLEKFYSSFGGVDTRSNKLFMDPKTFRNGSKNFRYNFQDEIQNANGWQHKTENTPVVFVDIFEYKYRDVNTGESKSQMLAVGVNGNLYRKLQHSLKWISGGVASSYSFYYDEVSDNFKLDVNGVGSVTVTDTMTLDQLKTALNALTGVLVDIVDNSGASVTSTKLAYLLDVRIEDAFNLNSSWYWERVPFPDVTCVAVSPVTIANFDAADSSQYTQNSVPFPTTLNFFGEDSYEGISSVNLNNAVYITDGGFPMKYDGKVVYRAGVPHSIEITGANIGNPNLDRNNYECSGITAKWIATGANQPVLTAAEYNYKFRYGFTDYNGAVTYGEIQEISKAPFSIPLLVNDIGTSAANSAIQIIQKRNPNMVDFPIFSARVNGTTSSANGSGITVPVHSGHNILPGMVVRQVSQRRAGFGYYTADDTALTYISFYALVTQVTATSITLNSAACDADSSANTMSKFFDGTIINAYFVDDSLIGKRPNGVFQSSSFNPAGFFLEIYRTKAGQQNTGPYYKIFDLPVPSANLNGDSSILDDQPDSSLSVLLDDQELGDELPRACKYLTKWQNTLVQAGNPLDETIPTKEYPSFVEFPMVRNFVGQAPYRYDGIVLCQEGFDDLSLYTESMTCDLQSIYWADPITPEGFPQDGLHEFTVDTPFNDRIKGIAPNKDALFALKERSTGVLTGDIGTNDISLEVLEDDIGLSSHKTLQEMKGSLVWLDPKKGFYSCVAGRLPVPMGWSISDYQQINSGKLDYSKAAALNARGIDMYICVVGTTWFVFDYSETSQSNTYRNCWYVWDGRFDAKSALFTSDSEILLLGEKVWKMKVTNTRFDMTDHKSAIAMDARVAWINFKLPTIDKNFDKVWISSIQGGFSLDIDLYSNYLEAVISSKSASFPELPKIAVKEHIKYPPRKMSATSIGFRNAEKNKFVRIQGFELEWAMDYDPSEPKR